MSNGFWPPLGSRDVPGAPIRPLLSFLFARGWQVCGQPLDNGHKDVNARGKMSLVDIFASVQAMCRVPRACSGVVPGQVAHFTRI
jgi:hypothetical protein